MKRSTLAWVAAVAVGTAISGSAIAATAAPTANNPLASKSEARQLAQAETGKVAKAAGVGAQEQLRRQGRRGHRRTACGTCATTAPTRA